MSEDETTQVLEDLRESILRLPRYSDERTQDNQTGKFIERNAVLGLFAMYLGATK